MRVLNINVIQTLAKVALYLFTEHLVLALHTLHLVDIGDGKTLR